MSGKTANPGVYFAWDDTEVLRYVGISHDDLKFRMRHLANGKSHNKRINEYVQSGRRFRAVAVPTPSLSRAQIFDLEESLIRAIGRENANNGPLWNKTDRDARKDMSKEERLAAARAAHRTLKNKRAARKAQAARTPEQRSEAARKAALTRKSKAKAQT